VSNQQHQNDFNQVNYHWELPSGHQTTEAPKYWVFNE